MKIPSAIRHPLAAARNAFTAWSAARSARRVDNAIALLGVTSPHSVRNAATPPYERKRIERAIATVNRHFPHYVRNWYESGNPFSDGTRSNVGNYPTDARYDQNPVIRTTMEIRCRYWEQNSPIMKATLDVCAQYVIGTHMPVVTSLARGAQPNGGSDAVTWRENAELVFHELCESAGLNGETMFALLDVACRRKKVDGGILAVETNKPGKVIIRRGTKYETALDVARPAYQFIESQRIGSALNTWGGNNPVNSYDGVQYKEIETRLSDGTVRKQLVKAGYWINDSFLSTSSTGTGQTVFVPIENCYYATSAHRINEPRGVSDFYAGETTLALLEDLLKMEMRAQEVQSDIALFITNGAGQVVSPKMQETLGAMNIKVSTGGDGKPVVTSKDIEQVKTVYEKIWGGRTMVGRTNDTLAFQAPTRPADATLNLWNYLVDSWCAAANVPRILVFAKFNKGQGTEVRAEIEKANAAFIKEFNLVWKPFIQRAWRYFIGWAIKNDERCKNAPADWDAIEVSPPRSVVVDLGYVSANNLAEMAAGVYPLHNWAQDHGTTKQKIIQHSVSDLFDIKLACQKMAERPEYTGLTVSAEEVRNNLAEVVKARAAMDTAEAAKATAELQTTEA